MYAFNAQGLHWARLRLTSISIVGERLLHDVKHAGKKKRPSETLLSCTEFLFGNGILKLIKSNVLPRDSPYTAL